MRETGYQWSRHEKESELRDEEVASDSRNSSVSSAVEAGGEEGVVIPGIGGEKRRHFWPRFRR